MPEYDPGVTLLGNEVEEVRSLVDLKEIDEVWAEFKAGLKETRVPLEKVIGIRRDKTGDGRRRVSAEQLRDARTAMQARVDFFTMMRGSGKAQAYLDRHQRVLDLLSEALRLIDPSDDQANADHHDEQRQS